MYMCIYTHIHTHTNMYVALGTTATYKHRASPGLKIQQELTEQVGCLWFQDISFTEAERFYKNILDNLSCDIYSSGLLYSKPQTVLLLLSFLIPAEDGKVSEGQHQNRATQDKNCTSNPEYCNRT